MKSTFFKMFGLAVILLSLAAAQVFGCHAIIVGMYKDSNQLMHGYRYDVASNTYTEVSITGAVEAKCIDINDNGIIVGSYKDSNGVWKAFIYTISTDTYSTISYPNSNFTQGWGINDNNHVVGEYTDSNGKRCGFFYDGSQFITLNYPGANFSRCHDINENGKIVARWDNVNDTSFGYHFDSYYTTGNTFNEADYYFCVLPAEAESAAATGINDNGIIAGWYNDLNSTNTYAFLYDGSDFDSYQYPSATITIGMGVNNSLQLVGHYQDSSGDTHGFFMNGSTFTPLNFPGTGVSFTNALGISNEVYY